jgi:hypothetical protein
VMMRNDAGWCVMMQDDATKGSNLTIYTSCLSS